MLYDKISAIANELAINAENRSQCRFHLCGRIVSSLKSPHGNWNECLQGRNIALARQTWLPIYNGLERHSHITTPFGAVNFSSTTFPVLRVAAGSNIRTSASVSAIVRCSTPRGTTQNS